MKSVQIVASVVTGFTMLATVGSGTASALEFNLSGTFAPTDYQGITGLAGGSFNGTYSYSGGVVPTNGMNSISSYSINLLNANNTVVETINSSTNGYLGVINGNPGNSGSDFLGFMNSAYHILQIAFPVGFQGVGNLTMNNTYPSAFATYSPYSFIYVTSASSTPAITQAVPEPSTIAGTVLGSLGLMAARFKYKKQRAF